MLKNGTTLEGLKAVAGTVLAAATLCFPVVSLASVAPVEYTFDNKPVSGSSTYIRQDADSSGFVTFALTPAPSLHLHTETLPENLFDSLKAGADNATLKYNYHISGAFGPSGTVDSLIYTQMSVTAGLTGTIGGYELEATLLGDHIPLSSENTVCIATTNFGSDCTGYGAFANSVLKVALSEFGSFTLSARAQGDGFSGDAFIDPVISLPDGYSIEFSSGVGNSFAPAVRAVPEPATIGLIFVGFVGFAKSRRKELGKSGDAYRKS